MNTARTSSKLWLVAAAVVAAHNTAMVFLTQGSIAAVMMALSWFGAFVCIEDRLADLRLEPQAVSMSCGAVLVLWAVWRSHLVFHLDVVIYVLALVQGLGLALFLLPPSRLYELHAPLLVLACLAVWLLVGLAVPAPWLSLLTARLSQLILILFFLRPTVEGNQVWLDGQGVSIAGSCSGSETIALLVTVGLIFTLALPLRSRTLTAAMVALTLPIAVTVNAVRIALLAFLNSRTWQNKQEWFEFFHEQSGSLAFSVIAVSIFSSAYLGIIERQIRKREV